MNGVRHTRLVQRHVPLGSGGLDHEQALGPNLTQGDVRMCGQQYLADRLVLAGRLGLVSFKLGDGPDDPMGFKPVLNLIDQQDSAFADG